MKQTLYDYCVVEGRMQLLSQWDKGKNTDCFPDAVSCRSNRKVWWLCEEGHPWIAQIRARVEGTGCPVCNGKSVIPGVNDLATYFPEVAAQWNAEKNNTLTPETVTPFSNRRVWWRCERGHEWIAAVSARTKEKSCCPYCTNRKVLPGYNDLATTYPTVAAQWQTELNAPLTPEMVTAGCKKKVWWKCAGGHEWKAVIYSRTGDDCGCPVCAGKRSVGGIR